MDFLKQIAVGIQHEYENIKSMSKTYGELEKNIMEYNKKLIWEGNKYHDFISKEMLELMKRDIGNINIEN
ncbi:hypothetical protein DS742_28005 [Lacrimispora amygdalina]|uniref:Uncharacterized protein n=1 Tax=Lacrimispora amygdalina TaxID=253257 RepID=A0A3E2N3X8_9FIRM|nr:hypothetical protein [Clostridium indicum]RFZ75621.1 hypothetical protein DS742_28005 [Clostridium indicum]